MPLRSEVNDNELPSGEKYGSWSRAGSVVNRVRCVPSGRIAYRSRFTSSPASESNATQASTLGEHEGNTPVPPPDDEPPGDEPPGDEPPGDEPPGDEPPDDE